MEFSSRSFNCRSWGKIVHRERVICYRPKMASMLSQRVLQQQRIVIEQLLNLVKAKSSWLFVRRCFVGICAKFRLRFMRFEKEGVNFAVKPRQFIFVVPTIR